MSKVLIGSVRHQLDDKYRMRIPAKFRDGVGSAPFVVPMPDRNCLYIISQDEFLNLSASITSTDIFTDSAVNEKATSILSFADNLVEDAQGRVRLEKNIRESFKIDKEIVFVGKINHIEVWAASIWDERFGWKNNSTVNVGSDK